MNAFFNFNEVMRGVSCDLAKLAKEMPNKEMDLEKLDKPIAKDLTDNVKVADDNENVRDLTDDEKAELKKKTGWPDKKIDDNCKIDQNNVIHYKTDCQDKEGTTSDCGVLYKRVSFDYNGVKIEGVFPEFESAFDTSLDVSDYKSSSAKQFSICNQKLKDAVDSNSQLRNKFTAQQLKDIENGRTPTGYTWHHSEVPGKMQLVETEKHDKRIGGAAHTGGNSIWGNKSVDTVNTEARKGETF